MENNKKKELMRTIKFTLFSLSAGMIQIALFELLDKVFELSYWLAYAPSLIASVVWNFTFNRKFTFKSAANVPIAMAKVFGFYMVFTPLSTWLGSVAESKGGNDFLILAVTMVANFLLEFLFCKFVVYRGTENTIEK